MAGVPHTVSGAREQRALGVSARQLWILVALAAAYTVVRMWHLTAVCFDGDEIFSVMLARQNWPGLIGDAVRDAVHPPLFYMLLKIWTWAGGESLLWVRVLPAAISLLALPPLYLLCRDLRLRSRETELAIALAALNPFLLYYAQDVRMYSLLFALGLTSTWLFYRLLSDGAARTAVALGLTVVNIALVYTHYYGWLLIATEWLYAAWRQRRVLVHLSVSICATAAAALPWMIAAGEAVRAKGGLARNLGWVQRPALKDFVWFYVDLTGFAAFPTSPLAVVPVTVFAVVLVVFLFQSRRAYTPAFLALFGLVPALLPFAASQWTAQSVWGHRHLIFMAGPFLMLIAIACLRVEPRWLRWPAVATMFVCIAVGAGLEVRGDDQKADWDILASRIAQSEAHAVGTVPVYALNRNIDYPLAFYIDELAASRTADLTFRPDSAAVAGASHIAVYKQGTMPARPAGHFWMLYDGSAQPPVPAGCATRQPLSISERYETVSAVAVDCPASPTM